MTKKNTTDMKMKWNRETYRKFNSKFHNSKVFVGGVKVADSKYEAKRRGELEILARAGKIKDLELQKKFELQPHFQVDGKWIKSINYYADFFYFDNDLQKWIVEDAKGFVTDVYKVKKKLFLYKFPQYVYKETYEGGKQKTIGGLEGEEENIEEEEK